MYKTKEEILPTGTIKNYYSYSGPFKKAVGVAEHYGFHTVPSVQINQKGIPNSNTWYIRNEEKDHSFNFYKKTLIERPHPVKVCYSLHNRRKIGNLKLEVFGCEKSIAEALVLRTALTILREHGHKKLRIDINSLGSCDSSSQFIEELKNYYREHAERMSPCCQTTLRQDPLKIPLCENDLCREINEGAPSSVAFLCESERRHFKEVLEYIEPMSVPYRINSQLVGSGDSRSRVLFQIRSQSKNRGKEEENIVARGERFEHHEEETDSEEKKIYPTVGISIDLKAGKSESYTLLKKNKKKMPNIYFVHLGVEAKRESLPILEDLRREKVRVHEALMRDSLWQQMRHAEHMRVKYVVIMGLQEVKERSVLVRNLETQEQDNVPFSRLGSYLKRVA